MIANNQARPVAVAADSSGVYWLNQGYQGGDGKVLHVSQPGGATPEALVSGLDFPGGLHVAKGGVYVAVTGTPGEGAEGSVVARPAGKSASMTCATRWACSG
jgi:hypothetical protein